MGAVGANGVLLPAPLRTDGDTQQALEMEVLVHGVQGLGCGEESPQDQAGTGVRNPKVALDLTRREGMLVDEFRQEGEQQHHAGFLEGTSPNLDLRGVKPDDRKTSDWLGCSTALPEFGSLLSVP